MLLKINEKPHPWKPTSVAATYTARSWPEFTVVAVGAPAPLGSCAPFTHHGMLPRHGRFHPTLSLRTTR